MITAVTRAPVGPDQNKLKLKEKLKEPLEVRVLSYRYVTHWHIGGLAYSVLPP
jgi:hypothetical protein